MTLPLCCSAKFRFIALLFRCFVGAANGRPPNNCIAIIGISAGNNRYMPCGMSFCLQNDRATNGRPYEFYRRCSINWYFSYKNSPECNKIALRAAVI